MSSSPWPRRRIGEFATRVRRINVGGEDLPPLSVTKGQGVMLQSEKYYKRIATDPRKYQVAEEGEFVFDPMSLYYGAVGRQMATPRGLASPDYVVFRTDDTVDPTFLHSLLRSPSQVAVFALSAEGSSQFGKRKRVYWSVFEGFALALPPLPEQRKIAAILSSVDDAIEKTQAVIDQIQIVKRAMMQELLTRGMPGRHTRFKKTEIGEVPEGWSVVYLADTGDWYSGGTPSKTAGEYWGGDVPWVSAKDMKVSWLWDAQDHVTEAGVENGTRTVGPRTLLMVVRGMILAHSFPVAVTMARVAFNQDLKALVPSTDFDPEFLLYWLQRQTDQLLHLTDSATHGTRRLPTEALHSIMVPRPPVDEQVAVAAELRSLDDYRLANESQISALVSCKSSLMSALLTGQVRVPLDEPTETEAVA